MPSSNNKMLTKLLNITGVKVVGSTEAHSQELILTIEAEKKEAICPICDHKSKQLHQNHTYLIKDMPGNDQKVLLKINRRQFKCKHCSKPFSEELLYVGERRKYTYRLAEQVVREVLNGDILNVAANYDLTEFDVRQMLSDVGKQKIKSPSTELKKLLMKLH